MPIPSNLEGQLGLLVILEFSGFFLTGTRMWSFLLAPGPSFRVAFFLETSQACSSLGQPGRCFLPASQEPRADGI